MKPKGHKIGAVPVKQIDGEPLFLRTERRLKQVKSFHNSEEPNYMKSTGKKKKRHVGSFVGSESGI